MREKRKKGREKMINVGEVEEEGEEGQEGEGRERPKFQLG